MARIRTIKPEFWEDEAVGMLTVHARLLFIATWNLADDEGLLRWTSAYLKASAFMYDDASVDDVQTWMDEITDAGLLFPYKGGKSRQELAYIVRFRDHQRINRPQGAKLPAPSIQSRTVKEMYADRDGWECHLCGDEIPDGHQKIESWQLSLDHVTPRSEGGTDDPSNIRATHLGCNKSRRNHSVDHERDYTLPGSPTDSLNGSVNDSRTDSPPEVEGKGREGSSPTGTGEPVRFVKRLANGLRDQGYTIEKQPTLHEAYRDLLGKALEANGESDHRGITLGLVGDYYAEIEGDSLHKDCRSLLARHIGGYGPVRVFDALSEAIGWGAGLPERYQDDPMALAKYVAAILSKQEAAA